jgi:hypothetical protein
LLRAGFRPLRISCWTVGIELPLASPAHVALTGDRENGERKAPIGSSR